MVLQKNVFCDIFFKCVTEGTCTKIVGFAHIHRIGTTQTLGQNKHGDTNNLIERTVCTNKHGKIDRKTNKGIIGESTICVTW